MEFSLRRCLTFLGGSSIMVKLYRGVAKFGIALGSGPRGLGLESPHSDHAECPYRI